MSNLDTHYRNGFPLGISEITKPDDRTGIAFSVVRMAKGQTHTFVPKGELSLLQLSGDLEVTFEGNRYRNRRENFFEDSPFAVHLSCEISLQVTAFTECEYCIFETPNKKKFPPVVYLPEQTSDELRGNGWVGDMALRCVRTIFDNSNSHPDTKLVLGEVINFPGRWSSYPPHHHLQPELYHYRFTRPEGYGHAESGETVYKVRNYDTLKIMDEHDHAQCSAPGYGMYYLWVIAHTEQSRYIVPEFTPEHSWVMDKEAKYWLPKALNEVAR